MGIKIKRGFGVPKEPIKPSILTTWSYKKVEKEVNE